MIKMQQLASIYHVYSSLQYHREQKGYIQHHIRQVKISVSVNPSGNFQNQYWQIQHQANLQSPTPAQNAYQYRRPLGRGKFPYKYWKYLHVFVQLLLQGGGKFFLLEGLIHGFKNQYTGPPQP